MYTKKYKLIQKGIELTRAKFSAPYFPDNCNISSLRENKILTFLYWHTVFIITLTCKRLYYMYIVLYL